MKTRDQRVEVRVHVLLEKGRNSTGIPYQQDLMEDVCQIPEAFGAYIELKPFFDSGRVSEIIKLRAYTNLVKSQLTYCLPIWTCVPHIQFNESDAFSCEPVAVHSKLLDSYGRKL